MKRQTEGINPRPTSSPAAKSHGRVWGSGGRVGIAVSVHGPLDVTTVTPDPGLHQGIARLNERLGDPARERYTKS